MRIAVCFAGHMRTLSRVYDDLLAHVLDVLTPDIFIHTWNSEGHQKIKRSRLRDPVPDDTSVPLDIERVRKQLDPKLIAVENNPEWIAQCRRPDGDLYLVRGQARAEFILSQLYSIFRVMELKSAWERRSGTAYDVVLKLRPDFRITSPIDVAEIQRCTVEPQTIFVPQHPQANHGHIACRLCEQDKHSGVHHPEVCDLFAFGSSAAMDHYMRLYAVANDVYKDASRLVGNDSRKHLVETLEPGVLVVNRFPYRLRVDSFATYNPERLLMHHLAGYRLIGSQLCGLIVR